ncbi:MAG: TetR/AcrR family transcriptional regulator [Pseudomonadota bacterium]
MKPQKTAPSRGKENGQEKILPVGNVRVTREDWLNLAIDTLISDGVEQVKVMTLGEKLGVSRSSFYWYFSSRQELLTALLDHWKQTNTNALVTQTKAPAQTITEAVCNVFHCVVNEELFNTALDFAIRDWARRSGRVRRALDHSDEIRLGALTDMFTRFGYEQLEAKTRARVLYYMQIGYNDAELQESMEERLVYLPNYLLTFTGKEARQSEIDSFRAYAFHSPKP